MSALSSEGTVSVDVKSMTKAERTELRRILKRRFKLLREQIVRRERELERVFTQQVEDERADAVSKIEAKVKPLIERQNKLVAAWSELFENAEKLGVSVRINSASLIPSLEELKSRMHYQPVEADSFSEARDRVKDVKEASGWSKLNLSEMEWRLDEQLAVGELESGSSLKFLEALPTVDTLLPLPSGIEIPELEEGF